MTEIGLSLSNATVGVVTVLSEEFIATCEVLGCSQQLVADGRIYRIGTVRCRDPDRSPHVVVVCRLLDMGKTLAAARTALLRQDCPNVSVLIMCGIAGAIPNPSKASKHVRLGDIVVSTDGVVQYDLESVSERRTEMRPRPHRPSPRLLEAVRLLQSEEEHSKRPWDHYTALGIAELEKGAHGKPWKRPPDNTDRVCEFDRSRPQDYVKFALQALGLHCRCARYGPIGHPADPERQANLPRVFHGTIASANRLLKNARVRNDLRRRLAAMAVEMEGAGVAEVAYQLQLHFLVVRGTCDYCNGDKNDLWHHYAAVIAASYVRAVLEVLTPVLLPGREDETQVSSIEAVIQSSNMAAQISAPVAEDTTTNVGRERRTSELERVLGEALEEQAYRHMAAAKQALDNWEYPTAFTLGRKMELWIDEHRDNISSQLAKEVYEQLAKIEIVRAIQARTEGEQPDTLRAQLFLKKAKDAVSPQRTN